MSKGKPKPVRFEADEIAALEDLKARTGLPIAEIIRRSVRLLHKETVRKNSVSFILDLGRLDPPPPHAQRRAG